MPVYKCSSCHHEWEDYKNRKCDWCGSDSRIIADKTDLEKSVNDMFDVVFEKSVIPDK